MTELMELYPSGLVVVANIGVWYNSRERYRKELPSFLRWLSELGENEKNLVLYRETAAQHWNHTANGYFSYEFAHSLDFAHLTGDSACVAIGDTRGDLDWRNRDFRHIIENEELKHIHVIKFRDVTAPLHEMHPDGPGYKDCTRYCYFPQMWQPIWYGLNEASKRFSAKDEGEGRERERKERKGRRRRLRQESHSTNALLTPAHRRQLTAHNYTSPSNNHTHTHTHTDTHTEATATPLR
jgi:hypothetical protein